MKKIIFWFFTLLLGFTGGSCGEEMAPINNQEDFQEFLIEEMDFQEIPALSLLIFEEDRILYETYQGQSNLELGVALEEDHMFLLASVSKVVTATALMQLYDKDLFALDDAINNYLDFPVNLPNQSDPISFRMLLTHSSGIADGPSLDEHYYYGEDSPIHLGDFLEDYLVPGGRYYNQDENFLDFEPGTRYEYSNVGTAVIAHLVEKISGRDFNSYCHTNIFEPLGMHHSYWRLTDALQAGTIVQPYDWDGTTNEVIEHYSFTDYPNGGLRTTGRDLFHLLKAFVSNGQSNGYQVLSPTSIDMMTSLQIPGINNEMGLHLFVMDEERKLWGHDGGEQGVATIMGFNLDTKVGVIVLSNQGEADLEQILQASYDFGLSLR